MVEDSLEIPDLEPDAGPEVDAGSSPKEPRRRRPVRDVWSCEGDLPAAEIKKTITSSYSTIRACYERRLKNHNMLQGSLNLQVKVGANGQVVATRVRGSLRDGDVRSCVQGQARTWTFPPPTGGCVVFDAPYNFTPKH